MFNTLKKRIKNEKGLSLVELLAVIVILAIVAAIAIPAIGNIIANSKANAEISDAIQILNAGKLYELDGNALPFEEEDAGDYVDVSERIQSFSVTKNSDNEYAITFTGTQINKEVGPYTLKDLSSLKVSGGAITSQ